MSLGEAASALLLLLLAAGAAGQHAEDRPLPASPCPDVFSYEGATVDWDRWYGVVLVATDTPLTGLRLDVWLSRPALALRHNWDGNVTTLDNKRFTILNLYKRIEPGPTKSVRIVVKFDEKEEIPILRAIELNGRRICSKQSDSQAYDDPGRQPSRHRPEYAEDELPLSHSAPSNSKYNFDRTTQRSTLDNSDAYEHTYKNAASTRAPSNAYEGAATRRPAYSDGAEDRPRPPARHDAPKRPVHHDPPEAFARPQYEAPPTTAAPPRPQAGHRKPSSGGGKHQAEDGRGRHPTAPPPRPEDFGRPAPARPPPPRRRPADDDRVEYAEAQRARPQDLPIDVRIGVQPLSEGDAYDEEARPTRQPGNERAGPPGLQKHGGQPPGLSGNPPPGHGGPVPGHNKGNTNNNYNYNVNSNNNNPNYNNNGDWQSSTEANRWPSSTSMPNPSTQRPYSPSGADKQCGRTLSVTPLITHGQNTSRGQWPWHAALYQVKGADLKYICGGTLISTNFVVTAAHCVTRATTGRAVDPDTIIAYLGKYHLHRWTNEEGVQQGKVAAIHVHPGYNTSDFRADLALLELSTSLSYTQYVRHVCLWGHEESASLNHVVNKDGYVVGWGYDEYGELTEELRMATMPIVAEQICLRSYPEFYSRFSNERTFCAGYKNGTSACNGDSGGGMVLPRFSDGVKVWFLRGLVSVSVSRDDHRVCNTEHYVVFTDLAKYRDWMTNYLR